MDSKRAADAELLEAVVENVPDMIFVKDAKTLAFVRFNRAGEALLGWSRAELIGKTDHDFYPRAQADFFHKKDREALAAGAGVVDVAEERIETRHGTRWLHTRKIAVGKPARWLLGISRDITRDVQARVSAAHSAVATPAPPRDVGVAMRQALATAQLVARDREVGVLVLGETGVGKGHLARRIHELSERRGAPFVEVNCAGLNEQLLESELFGHERGAFTGADRAQLGLVEAAEGGTLFLDEIGAMPSALQARLLTFLDEKTFRRVGGTRKLRGDVRVVCATNADLRDAVARGRFRQDLWYRIGVVPIEVPPLRQRKDELPQLALALLTELGRKRGLRARPLGEDVRARLLAHDWPGNVRELRNALERALILAAGGPLRPEHFALGTAPAATAGAALAAGGSVRLADVEERHIRAVLDGVGGNRTVAARLLGVSRSTLKRKIAAW